MVIANCHSEASDKILNGLQRLLASIMALNKNGLPDTYFYVSLRIGFLFFGLESNYYKRDIYIHALITTNETK
jgi:hypothetical protein